MAHPPIIYADDFMHWATADAGANGWFMASSTIHNSGGRGNRGYLDVYAGYGGSTLAYRMIPSSKLIIVGCAVRFIQGGNNPYDAIQIGGQTLYVSGAGVLSWGSTVASTPLPINAWVHLSVRIYFDAAGTVDVWMNETLLLSATGDTGAAATSVGFSAAGLGFFEIGDLVVMGAATNTDQDPLGDRAVTYLGPTGAGAYTDFVPNTGANYAAVGDATPDGDTTYVASATVGARDSYTLADLPAGAGEVDAVILVMETRKTDAGTRSLAPVLRIGGTDYDGTAVNLSASYVYQSQVYNVSPATSAAFTAAEVNGMELGATVSS